MVSLLVKGIIPDQWKLYTVPRGATVSQWVTDFAQRVKQLQDISQQVAQFGAVELKVGISSILSQYPLVAVRKVHTIIDNFSSMSLKSTHSYF